MRPPSRENTLVTIGSISVPQSNPSICGWRTYTQHVRPSTRQRRRALFEEALAAIRRDFADENLSLAHVARSIATSRRQLQRVFGEHGTSFRTELQRVRMAHAAELLRQERLPVASVARAVGYRQAAQFSKAFRRHHGEPPSAARGRRSAVAA
jgi:AraC family transcriptional regulator, regulatory protein of adaptative response / methylphosphotriester-DNA alkyltransferase methyltransferase